VLLGSGGIIAAADVAKAVVCGLDAVALDTAALVAVAGPGWRASASDRSTARIALRDSGRPGRPAPVQPRRVWPGPAPRDPGGQWASAGAAPPRWSRARAMFQADLEREASPASAGFAEVTMEFPPKPSDSARHRRPHTGAIRRGLRRWSQAASPPPALRRPPLAGGADPLHLAAGRDRPSARRPRNGRLRRRLRPPGLPRAAASDWLPEVRPIELAIPLNRRPWDPRIRDPVPLYGAGMSFGSVSERVMLARAMAGPPLSDLHSATGEGG